MTSLKNVVLVSAVVFASIAAGLVLWGRASGHVAPGDAGPIFAVLTMVLAAATLWASRRRPTSAKVN